MSESIRRARRWSPWGSPPVFLPDWVAVGVAVGVSAAGVMMVVLAVLDPEPTSKLGLLVGGGAVCVLTGGLTAVGILTRRRPPTIEMGAGGFKIRWE